jgi:uncharacterized membrane protein YphA (DoxX/SURF4 family)
MTFALSAWLTPAPHDDRRSVGLVRIALAVILITHPVHALMHREDAQDLARRLAAHDFPAGIVLAWGALLVQLASAALLAMPRFAVPGAVGSIVVVGGGAAALYAPRWYVVGGFSEDGHPGIELNALLLACLAGVLWAYRPRRSGVDALRGEKIGLDIIRVASALSLLAHSVGPFVLWDVAGMRGWGTAMTAAGWPFGLALVWSIKGIELVSSLLRISRRLVVPACFGHLSYLVPALWIEHHLHWFNVGPGENGIEFPLLIVVCTVACILAYWPRARLHTGAGGQSTAVSPQPEKGTSPLAVD